MGDESNADGGRRGDSFDDLAGRGHVPMLSSVSGTIRTDLIGEAGTEAEEADAAIRGARQPSERVASGRTPHVPSPHRNGGVP